MEIKEIKNIKIAIQKFGEAGAKAMEQWQKEHGEAFRRIGAFKEKDLQAKELMK